MPTSSAGSKRMSKGGLTVNLVGDMFNTLSNEDVIAMLREPEEVGTIIRELDQISWVEEDQQVLLNLPKPETPDTKSQRRRSRHRQC